MWFNRLISACVVSLVVAVITMVAGYWDSRGVIPVGDARIPSRMVAFVLIGIGGSVAAAFGNAVNWKSVMAGLGDNLQPKKPEPGPKSSPDTDHSITPESVAAIPVEVAHLLGCVHHLRVALIADEEGQELLDKVQIKVGRVTAKSVSE
jgi:hypothetical protein